MLSRFFLPVAALLASGASLAETGTGEERLLGYDIKPTGIEFRVTSGGCTHKDQFGLETLARKPLTVRLVRLRPDYCEALIRQGIVVSFTFAEMGVGPELLPTERARVTVVNALHR